MTGRCWRVSQASVAYPRPLVLIRQKPVGCIIFKQGPVAAGLETALGMSVRSMAEMGREERG